MNGKTFAAFQLSLRAAVAAGVSVGLAPVLRLEFPLVALISAVLVTDLDRRHTVRMGLPRMAGTLVGALVGAAVSAFLGGKPWEVGVAILVAMFLTQMLRLRGSAKVAGYVAGLVLLNHAGHAWYYAAHRIGETLLGVVAATLVSLAPKLLPLDTSGMGERGEEL
jgi:uncharacterized membrane protein YgaE (UPF0421/DUF939 family)